MTHLQSLSLIRRTRLPGTNRIIAFSMLALGIVSIAFSIVYVSPILAFIGLGLAFWGALLLYIAPSKHVLLELLTATAASNLSNIERILADSRLTAKGIYLPPRYLKDFESSLVFVPQIPEQPLPQPEEIDETKLHQKTQKGTFLTPPGMTLSKLFEKELGTSFTRTDLKGLQETLPKLLIETMEIAENININAENSTFTIDIANHIFSDLCQETRSLPKTHEAIGCPLASAIACALAKSTGKPITIAKEEQIPDGKTVTIQYQICEA